VSDRLLSGFHAKMSRSTLESDRTRWHQHCWDRSVQARPQHRDL